MSSEPEYLSIALPGRIHATAEYEYAVDCGIWPENIVVVIAVNSRGDTLPYPYPGSQPQAFAVVTRGVAHPGLSTERVPLAAICGARKIESDDDCVGPFAHNSNGARYGFLRHSMKLCALCCACE